jgi:O-acetyl-ADP-ribose deacetylase (regulator of RNase III)
MLKIFIMGRFKYNLEKDNVLIGQKAEKQEGLASIQQCKEYHINNSTIKIIFGNLLDSQAEVIVSSDDCYITMGGGVSMAIRCKESTGAIQLDVRKRTPAVIGDVVVSTAGTLQQKNIFHVITIDYKSISQTDIPEAITKDDIHKYIIGHSIDKCFLLLHAMDMTSIAFPQIGAGVAGIPFKKVAEVMAEAIGRNLRKTNKAFNVEIYLYDRFEKMEPWDFLPMFEQFSAQEAISRLLSEQTEDKLFTDDICIQRTAESSLNMDKDIFLSYSRKDSEIVRAIYEWLEKAGYKCWLDVDGMFSGVSYKKVIVDAIKRSKVLLFMSSENSNKSRNVVSEVSIAVEYGKKIIPVRLDMTSYSESIEYDIINHDYVVYDRSRVEDSNREMLKKIVSTLEMV